MSADALEQVKHLLTQLSPQETEELLEYLKSQLAPDEARKKRKMILEDLWRISDEIARREDPNSETMTQEFLRTRR